MQTVNCDSPVEEKAAAGEKPSVKLSYAIIKRILDFIIALAAAVVTAVPMLFLALMIKTDSKGKVIFRQKRIGRYGKPFTCYKFRTMSTEAPASCATSDLKDADSYITKVGEFLRKTSLDELPQIYNILRGDMSLIGPRPLIPEETYIHEQRLKKGVYQLRPGLTGLAQINGRDLVMPEEKVRWDCEYLEGFSFRNDVIIFLQSIINVLAKKDIHEGKQPVEIEEK